MRIEPPTAFCWSSAVAIAPDADINLVLTKVWPQGSVLLAGQCRVGCDDKGRAMTAIARQDVAASAANAPGIKRVHLHGRTFVNPVAGPCPVTVSQVCADGSVKVRWQGRFEATESAPNAHLAPTNFHLPPGTNADFRTLWPAQVAPLALGLLRRGPPGCADERRRHCATRPDPIPQVHRWLAGHWNRRSLPSPARRACCIAHIFRAQPTRAALFQRLELVQQEGQEFGDRGVDRQGIA